MTSNARPPLPTYTWHLDQETHNILHSVEDAVEGCSADTLLALIVRDFAYGTDEARAYIGLTFGESVESYVEQLT